MLVLAGVAAQFILLSAEFVAATQVLVYIGAVVVLFLFGTMLTRAKIGGEDQLTSRQWGIGVATALLLGGTVSAVLIDAFHAQKLPRTRKCRSLAPGLPFLHRRATFTTH